MAQHRLRVILGLDLFSDAKDISTFSNKIVQVVVVAFIRQLGKTHSRELLNRFRITSPRRTLHRDQTVPGWEPGFLSEWEERPLVGDRASGFRTAAQSVSEAPS